ncbi:MAG: hypothetical protein K2W97_04365 [Chthoniobacterales bacterium]|nr:hypothetical protein [Chthoniobacterales bacterium]
MFYVLSSSDFLTQLLAEGKNFIGQIALGNNFSLRHREDANVDASELKLYEYPEAAREIARYDEKGNYRPLKTAPSLCRGWLLQLQNIEEMALALEFFYPAALTLYGAWFQKKLEITSLRETLDRQTGMYRVTQKLSDEQATALIQKNCQEGCLRKILWPVTADQEAGPLIVRENEIPLLCREACNLLVAAARKVVKQEK